MNTPFGPETIALVLLVGLVVLALRVRSLNKRLKATESFIRGLIAASKNVPAPSDPALHKQWLARYDELKDCPKKTAYKNRLVDAGVIDDEGKLL